MFYWGRFNYKSIDIVQIISLVEDKLEEKGFEGFDLLEKLLKIQFNFRFLRFN